MCHYQPVIVGKSISGKPRSVIEGKNFAFQWKNEQVIPFTVSIGVATRQPGEREVSTVLKRADEALYRAKEGGRNRVMTE